MKRLICTFTGHRWGWTETGRICLRCKTERTDWPHLIEYP